MSDIYFLAIAFFAGALMAVQGSFNSLLSKNISLLQTTFIVHLLGLLLTGLLMLVLAGYHLTESPVWQFASMKKIPLYAYLGGFLGVAIVYGVAMCIPKIGVADATTAIIVGQVGTALIIDGFGLFGLLKTGFSWSQGIGLVVMAIGAHLMLR